MEVISSKISLPTSDTTQMETDDKSEKEELRLNLDESDSDDELIVSRGVKIYQKTKAKAFDSDDEDNSHLLTNLPVPSNEMDTSEDSQLFKEVNKSSRRFLLKDSDDEDEKPLSKLELIDNIVAIGRNRNRTTATLRYGPDVFANILQAFSKAS